MTADLSPEAEVCVAANIGRTGVQMHLSVREAEAFMSELKRAIAISKGTAQIRTVSPGISKVFIA